MREWIASKGVRRTEPEYELKDALGQSGCAVCRLALRTAARQLDILSYENVNDLELRAKLRDARGFCNRHAWQLLEQTRDPLGVALIYKDVLNTLVPELRPDSLRDRILARLRGRPASGLASRLATARECPVCVAEQETEDVYLRLIGARIAEPSFREAWEASSGLCWPHLLAALPRARSDEVLAALVQQPPARWRPGAAPTTDASSAPADALRQPGLDRANGTSISHADGGPAGVKSEDDAAAIRALALSHGRWSADRTLLPPDLVVDLQQRRLEAVTRPAGERRPECHACQEAAEAMERRLSAALVEGIGGEELGRTCERHAWQLARRRAGALRVPLALLGAARKKALAAALDRARLERPAVLTSGQAAAAWTGRRVAASLAGGDADAFCGLCSTEAALERAVTESAVGMRRPVPLCRIHLSIAAKQAGPRPHWANMLAHQAARWRQLSMALAEFIRKHDYRYNQEPRGDERDSPWRAVEEIAGRKGVA